MSILSSILDGSGSGISAEQRDFILGQTTGLKISAISGAFQSAASTFGKNMSIYDSLAPTKYFDPSLTTGANNGTSPADAYRTVAALEAGVTGDQAGVILGWKRGTVLTEEVTLTAYSSRADKPFIILPYGTGDLPKIDLGQPVSPSSFTIHGIENGLTVYKWAGYGTIWKNLFQVTGEIIERRILPMGAAGGTSLATRLTQLGLAGQGYCFVDIGGTNDLYVIPFNDADLTTNQCLIMTNGLTQDNGGTGLSIKQSNVATIGNVFVHGLAVRHTQGTAIGFFTASSTGSMTSIGRSAITGCDIRHCCSPIILTTLSSLYTGLSFVSGAGSDGIDFDTGTETVRFSDVYVGHNLIIDVGNNGIELNNVNAGTIEGNVCIDNMGAGGLLELYTCCSNTIARYNYCGWIYGYTRPIKTWNGSSINNRYNGRAWWAAGLDASTRGSGVPTTASAAKSANNIIELNTIFNAPCMNNSQGTAETTQYNGEGIVVDDGTTGVVIRYNNIHGKNLDASRVRGIVVGRYSSATLAPPATAPVITSNHLFLEGAQRIYLSVSGEYAGGYTATVSNNMYCGTGAEGSTNDKIRLNAAISGGATLPAAITTWAAALSETGSSAARLFVDANGLPVHSNPSLKTTVTKSVNFDGIPTD